MTVRDGLLGERPPALDRAGDLYRNAGSGQARRTGVAALALMMACGPAPSSHLDRLVQDSGERTSITRNPMTGTPSFIRTSVPVFARTGAPAFDFLERYPGLFGLDPRRELRRVGQGTGPLGMRHTRFEQVHHGVPVYGATATVHLARDGRSIVAVTNHTIPDLRVDIRSPRIEASRAMGRARRMMPGAAVVGSKLAVYPGAADPSAGRLAWMVELRDDALPARRVYVVSARSGELLDVLDRLTTGRDRRTHSANNGFGLPGALRRTEGEGPVGDEDVDRAHDYAGETYDYFADTHDRDSYDNLGAMLSSTAHYRANFQNAFWNGRQMVYGDGYAVKDVAAHEMTHAVTEYSARLEYRWQSGALNESFSDIFGAMVDRDDWLIGEDLPQGPIRNMADPPQFNHPGHADDWRAMCGDNEGVHINSGIHNKAYVNVAEAIGKDRAERIFYRGLTTYLGSQSSFEDARSAALQAAADLFGEDGADYRAVDQGFAAVGIDGEFAPPRNGCGSSSSNDSHRMWLILALVIGMFGLCRTMWRV